MAVRDHGVGFEAVQSKQVFHRFWRGDPARARTVGGTGLGLAISMEDANLHGGWLTAWGRPGMGAQFRLTLAAKGWRHPGGFPAAHGSSRSGRPGWRGWKPATCRRRARRRPIAGTRSVVASDGSIVHGPVGGESTWINDHVDDSGHLGRWFNRSRP